jgi:ribonuclease J
MWLGYLKNDDGMLVHDWFEEEGSRAAHIHTSGHGSPADLRSFAHALNAK